MIYYFYYSYFRFWVHYRFPGVIGAIDGTHVAIWPPNSEREHLYINRKLYHSLNVLIVYYINQKFFVLIVKKYNHKKKYITFFKNIF